jgi:hypothetical protein
LTGFQLLELPQSESSGETSLLWTIDLMGEIAKAAQTDRRE